MVVKNKYIQPQVLILASRYDLTCDYVVSKLRKTNLQYFRLNSEDISESILKLDPARRRFLLEHEEKKYLVTPDCLRSVLFRRPVFLRDYGGKTRSPSDNFSRIQWAAFMRNLILFQEARWINDPTSTYRAEHKAFQISVATKLGFDIPETKVTNSPNPTLFNAPQKVAIKGLDTVLLRTHDHEMFGFTTFENSTTLEPDAWHSAPAIIQAALVNKLDIRVTVIENKVFAASITKNGLPISGDWRMNKADVNFSSYTLPDQISDKCIQLVKQLGLRFGGIDLAMNDGKYYFLEINPTGEWAWLVDSAGLPIDKAMTDALIREESVDV